MPVYGRLNYSVRARLSPPSCRLMTQGGYFRLALRPFVLVTPATISAYIGRHNNAALKRVASFAMYAISDYRADGTPMIVSCSRVGTRVVSIRFSLQRIRSIIMRLTPHAADYSPIVVRRFQTGNDLLSTVGNSVRNRSMPKSSSVTLP
jgi:hypothetical protein